MSIINVKIKVELVSWGVTISRPHGGLFFWYEALYFIKHTVFFRH